MAPVSPLCLDQERWRATAEQSKVESLQHSLEEQRRVMTQQLSMERAELERAKVRWGRHLWVFFTSHESAWGCTVVWWMKETGAWLQHPCSPLHLLHPTLGLAVNLSQNNCLACGYEGLELCAGFTPSTPDWTSL